MLYALVTLFMVCTLASLAVVINVELHSVGTSTPTFQVIPVLLSTVIEF